MQGDGPALLAIYTHAVLHTQAIFREAPPSPEAWAERLARHDGAHPLRVAVDAAGGILGFAGALPYDAGLCGYAGVGEVSVYVAPAAQGLGVGGALLRALVEAAEAGGARHLLSRVALPNPASVAIHRRAGFEEVGVLRRVGLKHGQVLDVMILQRILAAGAPELGPGLVPGGRIQ